MWSEYPEIFQELKLVEEFIKNSIHSRNKTLEEIVQTLIDSGGKRIRPLFVINSAKFGEYRREKTIPIAGAIEILHNATLVHDDIIDNSKIRRGVITVSEKYGTDMAIYTGDYLFTKAVLMLSGKVSKDKMEIIAKGLKSICEGEVDQFLDRFNINTSIVSYLKKTNRKTAVLFSAACALGADSAECHSHIVKTLTRFGFYYGMAFQIRDDINDFILEPEVTGKPTGNDISKGVITLPLIYAMAKSETLKRTILTFKDREGKVPCKEIAMAITAVKELGGIKYSEKILEKYIERGIDTLNSLPNNRYKGIFQDLITRLRLKLKD
ncbi:MAG: polyprenyl synthetase family protein [Firmicutes bacterium]|nr:polyprenyl synthetase family protein [Bacillota bacterium]